MKNRYLIQSMGTTSCQLTEQEPRKYLLECSWATQLNQFELPPPKERKMSQPTGNKRKTKEIPHLWKNQGEEEEEEEAGATPKRKTPN